MKKDTYVVFNAATHEVIATADFFAEAYRLMKGNPGCVYLNRTHSKHQAELAKLIFPDHLKEQAPRYARL